MGRLRMVAGGNVAYHSEWRRLRNLGHRPCQQLVQLVLASCVVSSDKISQKVLEYQSLYGATFTFAMQHFLNTAHPPVCIVRVVYIYYLVIDDVGSDSVIPYYD